MRIIARLAYEGLRSALITRVENSEKGREIVALAELEQREVNF